MRTSWTFGLAGLLLIVVGTVVGLTLMTRPVEPVREPVAAEQPAGEQPAATGWFGRLWESVTGNGPAPRQVENTTATPTPSGTVAGATADVQAATGAIRAASGMIRPATAGVQGGTATQIARRNAAATARAGGAAHPQETPGGVRSATGAIASGTDTDAHDSLFGTPGPTTVGTPQGTPEPTVALPGTVQGHVVSKSSGRVMPGVKLTLSGDGGSQTTTTEEDGFYAFATVDPGAYTVEAQGQAYARKSVTVEPSMTHTVDFVLQGGGALTGRVLGYLDEPLTGVTVRLYQPSGPYAGQERLLSQAQTDSEGVYRLFNASPGERVRVAASFPGYAQQSRGPFLVDDDPYRVDDLRLQPGGGITGIIHNGEQEPVEGARLEAHVIGAGKYGSGYTLPETPTSDSAGYYEFTSVPPGEWEVEVTASGYAPARDSVLLAGDPAHVELNFTLEAGNRIAGKVTAEGQAVSGAEVFLHLPQQRDQTQSAGDGTFEFASVPDGVYMLTARHREYSSGRVGNVRPGDENVEIAMPAQGELALQVVDSSDQPVAEYSVSLTPRMQSYLYPAGQVSEMNVNRRDGIGRWPVVAGRYGVLIQPEDETFQPWRGEVDVHAGKADEPRKIQLEGGRALDVQVLDALTREPVPNSRIREVAWYWGHFAADPGNFHIPPMEDPGGSAQWTGDGWYLFNSLPAGPVTVYIRADGYAPWLSQGLNMDAPPEVLVAELKGGVNVTGRVTHRGVPFVKAAVELEIVDSASIAPGTIPPEWKTETDTQGRFAIPRVPEGEYLLRLERNYRGSILFRRFRVLVGAQDVYLDLTLPGGSVHATIRDASTSEVLHNAVVTLEPISVQPPPGPEMLLPSPLLTLRHTDEDGNYTFICLPPGHYVLNARLDREDRAFTPVDFQLGQDEELPLEEFLYPPAP